MATTSDNFNSSDANQWLEQAEEGQRYKEQYGTALDWNVYKDYYRGQFGPGTVYFHNLFYIHYNTTVAATYYRDPRILVTPETRFGMTPDPERAIKARVLESIDNILLRRMNIKDVAERLIFNAVFCGQAPYKIGYGAEFYQNFDDKKLEKGKKKTEFDTTIKAGFPWVGDVEPELLIVPFGTRRLKNVPWIIHIILRRTEDVRNSTYYENVSDLTGTHTNFMDTRVQELVGMDESIEWTEIHEVHDYREGVVGSYIPGHGKSATKWIKPRKESKMQELLGSLPFGSLSFNYDPEFFWTTPDAVQIEPHQLEINETMKLVIEHRRAARLKFIVDEGKMDLAELDKALSEKAGVGLRSKGNPNDAILILQPHIPQDLPMWGESVLGNFRHVMGTSKPGSGTEAGGRRTATEIQAMTAGQDIRTNKRRDKVADVIRDIIEKSNAIIKNIWSIEQVIPVVGLEGAIYWVKFKSSDLAGDYRVKIDVDSLNPVTLSGRKQEMMSLLQAVGQNEMVNTPQLLNQLMSQFDWLDLPTYMPNATPSGPVGMQDFQKQQGSLKPDQINSGTASAAQALGLNLPSGGA